MSSRILVDHSLCWVLGQASSSQSKLSCGTDDVFDQKNAMACLQREWLVSM